MKTRYIWLIVLVAFAVTLAVVVGQRLSSEAMAVIVGVVAGVAASIPTSLIVVWVATRSAASHAPASRRTPAQDAGAPRTFKVPRQRSREAPPVVILQQPLPPTAQPPGQPLPQNYPYLPAGGHNVPYPAPARPERQFNILGGMEVEDW